jgi:hypothetical protein
MPSVEVPQSQLRFGIAVGDITPPIGIYCRMWGAARHDVATGVHRPLRATAMALAPIADAGAGDELVVIALDHCLLRAAEMDGLLSSVSSSADVPIEKLLVLFSHTHSAGLMSLDRAELPGGEMIEPYLEKMAATVTELIMAARHDQQPAHIVYGRGRCDLAVQRDFWDDGSEQFVCGYNPEAAADDTLVVARVSNEAGKVVASLVNYACHPTTLAWQNSRISPDFPGAMREVIENETGAPCVFVQGASGDLAPKEQYTGDPDVADRNGRQLGFAALSTLASLPAAETAFRYSGPVVSGATLGAWGFELMSDDRRRDTADWRFRRITIDLPYIDEPKSLEQLRADVLTHESESLEAQSCGDEPRAADSRAMAERARRRAMILEQLPAGEQFPLSATVLKCGDAIWVAVECEHYQQLQIELRRRFSDRPLIVATIANGSRAMYLPPRESYGKGIYQEQVAVLAAGSLETVIERLADEIEAII